MPRTADVAVVGDGVIGASIACHLAAAGVDVAWFRHGLPDRSATRNSAAQVRVHQSDPHDARMTAASLETFERWPEAVGGNCGFQRTGFAFLVGEEYTSVVSRTVAEVASLGVETSVLCPADLAALYPVLDLAGVGVAAYEPRGGFADPVRTTEALADRALSLGAVAVPAPSGARLCRDGDRVTGAAADGETVSAGEVVVAAGVGSGPLCANAGIRLDAGSPGEDGSRGEDGSPGEDGSRGDDCRPGLPVTARRVAWAVADVSGLPGADRLCMVIDDISGTYFRPAGEGRLLFRIPLDGVADAGAPSDGSASLAEAHDRLERRLPGAALAPICATAVAQEAYTRDGRALIGRSSRYPGLYLATGFSGGGFKMAPAVGRFVATDLTAGATTPTELAPYRPDRFTVGSPTPVVKRYRHM